MQMQYTKTGWKLWTALLWFLLFKTLWVIPQSITLFKYCGESEQKKSILTESSKSKPHFCPWKGSSETFRWEVEINPALKWEKMFWGFIYLRLWMQPWLSSQVVSQIRTGNYVIKKKRKLSCWPEWTTSLVLMGGQVRVAGHPLMWMTQRLLKPKTSQEKKNFWHKNFKK